MQSESGDPHRYEESGAERFAEGGGLQNAGSASVIAESMPTMFASAVAAETVEAAADVAACLLWSLTESGTPGYAYMKWLHKLPCLAGPQRIQEGQAANAAAVGAR